jgi:hypothetical protein
VLTRRALVFLCLATGAPLGEACHRGEHAGKTAPAASLGKPAPPPNDFRPGKPDRTGRFASDLAWQRASSGEPHHLAILANREGAMGLLEGLLIGRSIGLTALAALPYADDAELALGRLCEIAERRGDDPPEAVLESVHAIVARPPTQTEELDNSGYIGCLSVMKKLAEPGLLKGHRLDLAVGSVELIEEHRDAAKH